jgi:Fe-S-cluster containining protein
LSEAVGNGAARRFPSSTGFSYACLRCLRCCHDKLIQVNPYEAARLARNLGVTTSIFIEECLESGLYLKRRDDGSCVFLGREGCAVHPDRPLVCRLYPLGRHIDKEGAESFSLLPGHRSPRCVTGSDGSVLDYIREQGATQYIAEADAYLQVLQRLFVAWWAAVPDPGDDPAPVAEVNEEAPPDLKDVDRALAAWSAAHGQPGPPASRNGPPCTAA